MRDHIEVWLTFMVLDAAIESDAVDHNTLVGFNYKYTMNCRRADRLGWKRRLHAHER